MKGDIVGLSFSVEPGSAAYVPLAHDYAGAPSQLSREHVLQLLKPMLEQERPAKVGHDLKYLAHVLQRAGIRLAGMRFDSMLESYLFNSTATRHELGAVIRKYLGLEKIAARGRDRQRRETDRVSPGSRRYRARSTSPRARTCRCACIERSGRKLTEVPALSSSVRDARTAAPRGAVTDGGSRCAASTATCCGKQSSELAARMRELRDPKHIASRRTRSRSIRRSNCRKCSSGSWVCRSLRKTPTGQPSTAEDVLEELAENYELPRMIMDYREFAKLKSTYTDKLPLTDQSRDGTGPYHVSPGRRCNRSAVIHRSKPAEHPDSRAGRPTHPSGIRCAAGLVHRRG